MGTVTAGPSVGGQGFAHATLLSLGSEVLTHTYSLLAGTATVPADKEDA